MSLFVIIISLGDINILSGNIDINILLLSGNIDINILSGNIDINILLLSGDINILSGNIYINILLLSGDINILSGNISMLSKSTTENEKAIKNMPITYNLYSTPCLTCIVYTQHNIKQNSATRALKFTKARLWVPQQLSRLISVNVDPPQKVLPENIVRALFYN